MLYIGVLTNWGQWGACSENCQSNPNQIPTRMRSRQCINFSFGGNCEGAALTMTEACNVGVGCAGSWVVFNNTFFISRPAKDIKYCRIT